MLYAHRQKAQQIYSQYQQDRTKVINDKHLSGEGKRQRLAELEATYKRQASANRDEAEQELDRIRQRVTKEAAAARKDRGGEAPKLGRYGLFHPAYAPDGSQE
jgi:hypothetical protein